MFTSAKKIVVGVLRERKKAKTRSPHWATVRAAYLKEHGECAACGSKTLLQVHHVVPFHEQPELELDPANFITLCLWQKCHIDIGHGDDYKCYNPKIRAHAEALRAGASRKAVVADAKAERLVNDGIKDT